MKQSRVRALTECAILLALSVVLSYIRLFTLPFEGSITLLSMLPVCLASLRHGVKQGLFVSFAYAWFQILQGGVFAWGLTPMMLLGSLLFDYIIAFTALGLAGLFRKHGLLGAVSGVALACFARFLSHFLAGVILWANFEQFIAFGQEWVGRPWLYSLCYNGVYMLPETVFTVLGAYFVLRTPALARLIREKKHHTRSV